MAKNKSKRKSAQELVEELRTFHHNASADLVEALLVKLRTAEDKLDAVNAVVNSETSEPADEYMEGRAAALDEVERALGTAPNKS